MARAIDLGKLGTNGLFKNNQSFELRVRQHCQSKCKPAVQLMNGRGIIHIICLQQMREIRRVRPKVSYFFISLEKFIFDHFSAKIE